MIGPDPDKAAQGIAMALLGTAMIWGLLVIALEIAVR